MPLTSIPITSHVPVSDSNDCLRPCILITLICSADISTAVLTDLSENVGLVDGAQCNSELQTAAWAEAQISGMDAKQMSGLCFDLGDIYLISLTCFFIVYGMFKQRKDCFPCFYRTMHLKN